MKAVLTTAVLILALALPSLALSVPRNPHHARSAQAQVLQSHHAARGARPAHGRTSPTAADHASSRAALGAAHLSGRANSRAASALASASGGRITRRARLQRAVLVSRRHRSYERFTASSFVTSQGQGDVIGGEDPTIRAAVIDALGNMNGTAVVINASNGRVLAMVNQKLALSPGAEPCSTIKLSVGLAALSEGLVTRDTPVNLGGFRMNLTEALAHSNNLYFEELGRELGFERVHHYATQFGLGELAGYGIAGEQLGTYPEKELPASEGGVGRMCSFGQGVSMTPMQLGAFVASIANGGTLYYLQHPTTAEEVAAFEPRIKRTLDISRFVPEMRDGMAGAVEYGTARSLRVNFHELPVLGKTGTCSDKGTRFGWFASYSDSPIGTLVTVFFLEGGRPVFGPRAAELTGLFYRSLWDRNYFAPKSPVTAQTTPANAPFDPNLKQSSSQ